MKVKELMKKHFIEAKHRFEYRKELKHELHDEKQIMKQHIHGMIDANNMYDGMKHFELLKEHAWRAAVLEVALEDRKRIHLELKK